MISTEPKRRLRSPFLNTHGNQPWVFLLAKKASICYSHTTMLTTAKKQKVIADFGRKAGDTGSPEVQIALLSEQITKLTDHLKDHKKDTHSRRGLIIMVANRRKILNYLKKKDFKTYEKILKQVGLK